VPRGSLPVTLFCLVAEISILVSFLHTTILNKVILYQPRLFYSLVVFEIENGIVFCRADLVIAFLNLEVILLKNESSDSL
jgi:hypothetical protein